MFNLEEFINKYVTHRDVSMFAADIRLHYEELRNNIEGKGFLIIGGAGSIGASFIRAVLLFHPSELVIVDTNENALAELARSLRSDSQWCGFIPDVFLPYPMDYSSITFQRMFRRHVRSNGRHGFDIVVNFSAHKHVRSEKDIYSVEALIRNNVINASILLELLAEYPPEAYFCVSTDKAANPVNIMGASKRIMEDLIFSYSDFFPVKTARFANVAFSNGSLPDGFLRRLKQHQPLSAPSDVKRYFVSPQESGQICMLAAMLGGNREIFFPKLEERDMARFDRIARDLLAAYGYRPLECNSDEEAIEMAGILRADGRGDKIYPVHFSMSDTSGEKSFEEFYVDGECVDMGRFLALGVITGKDMPKRLAVERLVKELDGVFDSVNCSKIDVLKIISGYLPNFLHLETGKNLDGKM